MDFITPDASQPISTTDFEGAARLFITSNDNKRLFQNATAWGIAAEFIENAISADRVCLDLVISEVSFASADFNQISTYSGDEFGINYFGKSPITLSINASLLDDYSQAQKHRLFGLYRDLFRLSAVARYNIVPNIEFARSVAQGAFLNLQLAESANQMDIISVRFEFLIFNLFIFNPENSGLYQISNTVFNNRLRLDAEVLAQSIR